MLRDLKVDELDNVSGAGVTAAPTQTNGSTKYTDYYDSNNNFIGTYYEFGDGTSRYWDATTGTKTDFGSTYTNTGFGYGGVTGGLMTTWGGDTYGYIGIGLPGPTLSQGYDLDGNLSGWSVNAARTPVGAVTIAVDPTTGTVTGTEVGYVSPSITYAWNLSDIQVHSLTSIVYSFADGFVRTYYPNNVDSNYQQP